MLVAIFSKFVGWEGSEIGKEITPCANTCTREMMTTILQAKFIP